MQNKCTFAGIICEKNNKKGYLVTQFVTCKPFHRSNWVRRRLACGKLPGYVGIPACLGICVFQKKAVPLPRNCIRITRNHLFICCSVFWSSRMADISSPL